MILITYLMMEMQQETTYVTHHIQKIVAFFASMRNFARGFKQVGIRVHYLSLDDKQNRHSLTENIIAQIEQHGFERFEYLLPDEYRLDRQLLDLCEKLEVSTEAYDTEHFITGREDLAVFFGKKNYLMETFYRHVRKNNGWLMDSDKPEGRTLEL